MKAGEIIRIIIITLVGGGVMSFIQPLLYDKRILLIKDVPIPTWIAQQYNPGAFIVFGLSVLATVLWYVLGARANIRTAKEAFNWNLYWWLFLLMPIIGICLALYFFNESKDALLSLTGLYIFNVILLYWLPTVTSSPKDIKRIPPGASIIRR